MKIFCTIGNLNFNTIDLVAKSVRSKFGENAFDKLVILNSKESEKVQNEQVDIYRKYIKTGFSVLGINVFDDGKIRIKDLIDIFSMDGDKIIDLSNGQKVTSALLYMAASLCNIKDIYYLILHKAPRELPPKPVESVDYEYCQMGKFEGAESFAKISYFDLVYYQDEVNAIFDEELPADSLYEKAKRGLRKGISDFFGNYADGRSAINNVTISNEGMMGVFLSFLKNEPTARDFAERNGVALYDEKKYVIGRIQFFYKKYTRSDEELKQSIVVLRTIPSLMSTIREYRNLTAHSSRNTHEFTSDEVRIAINIMLEIFKCAKKNDLLWSMIKGENMQ